MNEMNVSNPKKFTLKQTSATLSILAFLGTIIFKYHTGQCIVLSEIVIAMIAAGMLPHAITLAFHSFFPAWKKAIENKDIQISIYGLILIFIFLNTLYKILL